VEKILAPSTCPSCGEFLKWENHILYCRNVDCGSQSQKKIEHFAKTLKIKGLGPAAIEKLELSNPGDLYFLNPMDIEEALGSKKLAEKLFVEINNSRNAPLNMVLPALSIRLIGRTATEKLSKICNGLHEVDEEVCSKAGLGPAATESLLKYLDEGLTFFLPQNMMFEKPVQRDIVGTVCISGKLKSFKTKAEATKALEQHGYTVKSSVTKDVTVLVNESGIESQKTIKARNDGLTIVENLLEFLGENYGTA
jgi:NAD-dependent DNA ligase